MEKTRSTRQKQLILDILRHSDTPITATALYRRAVLLYPSLAKSTVYRNLDAMAARGEVERGYLETGESFFRMAGQGHRHYMICRDCNRMQDLPGCPMAGLSELVAHDGFVPTEHVVQVYGYCRECASKHK